ncbi:hypothetical protein [Gordonia insulae]|uniref:Uncharacterized protein n=1 Tax=Gordonia insulae TaxID=2420509 RepID=A0A3G8JFA1_9ACTN|nr:hypothetical protein [Gordonia insulae]AZG43841.1 hypothetical protein D7316_00412 [Gordonia insulae]
MTISRSRIFGTTAACAAIAATGFVMAAPANAAVSGLTLQEQSGYGSVEGLRGAGCTYVAKVDVAGDNSVVTFKVDGPGNADSESTVTPADGTATYPFKPAGRGTYKITAVQGGISSNTVTAEIGGNGIQIDPETCLVLAP